MYKRQAGDVLIRGIATVLREAVGNEGKIYRIGGDEFVVLIHDITDDGIEKVLKRIEKCRVDVYKRQVLNRVRADIFRAVKYILGLQRQDIQLRVSV